MSLGTPLGVAPARRTSRASVHTTLGASAVLAWGRRLFSVALVAVGLAACHDEPATAPRATPLRAVAAPAAGGDSLALVPLARGLAAALADAGLRRQVVEDLRDSPFPEHGIHAVSYLAGPRGRPLLEAMARGVAQQPAELLALAARTPDLALVLPVRWDRVSWTGDSASVAVASARTRAQWVQLGRTVAYTATGDSVPVVMDRPVEKPVVALLKADAAFGADPETVRSRAPGQKRRTVTTHAETYGAVEAPVPAGAPEPGAGQSARGQARPPGDLLRPRDGGVTTQGIEQCNGDVNCICYWDPSDYRCPRYEPPTYDGLQLAYTDGDCRYSWINPNYSDTDGDGLDQWCEEALARAFRPYMAIDPYDQDARREEYWAAYPAEDGANQIQLFYAFSYYYDRGSYNWFNAKPHQGDSEFLVVRVQYFSNGYWQVRSAFFAAHWRSPTDASQNVTWDHIEYRGPRRGRSLVYVSWDKHASYNTLLACDRGAYSTDTCDGNRLVVGDPRYEAEVVWWANLGNPPAYFNINGVERYYPGAPALIDCISAREISSNRSECFWSGPDFRGWQQADWLYGSDSSGDAAGPYWRALLAYLYRGNP